MDFRVPEEITALRESFAAFLDREVRPLDEQVRDQYWTLTPDTDAVREAAQTVKTRAAKEGFYAAHLPESVGGWGLSTLGTTLLVADAARSGLRLPAAAPPPPSPEGPTPLLLDLPDHLWDSYVRPLVRG